MNFRTRPSTFVPVRGDIVQADQGALVSSVKLNIARHSAASAQRIQWRTFAGLKQSHNIAVTCHHRSRAVVELTFVKHGMHFCNTWRDEMVMTLIRRMGIGHPPAMHVHPAIARAIKQHEGGTVTVEFHTSEPFVRSSSGKAYFTKIASAGEKEQFFGEAECLKAMHTAAPGIAPRLIECGLVDEETAEYKSDVGRVYFVSEYKKMGPLTDASAKKLAKRLAMEMHQFKGTQGFGFPVPTFCGRTRQDNGWHDTWEQCFAKLLGDLLDSLKTRGGYQELCGKGDMVLQRYVYHIFSRGPVCPSGSRVIPALLGPLVIQPVLLHGDLWVCVMVNCTTHLDTS